MAKPGVALQMFSVRDEIQKDFVGTLKAVSDIGYRAVELVSYFGKFGLSAAELKRVLADLGLQPIGVHVGVRHIDPSADTLDKDLDETVSYYAEAGVPEIIVASLPHENYDTAEGCTAGGQWLAKLSRRCFGLGAGLSYHNHHSDFHRFGDKFGLDLLLAASTPATLGMESDVYWITYAGLDPAKVIGDYAQWVRFVHLKDRPAKVEGTVEDMIAGRSDGSGMFAEVGEGVVDWPAVFRAAEATGAKWYVVEQDAGKRPMLESVGISLRHLKEWGKA